MTWKARPRPWLTSRAKNDDPSSFRRRSLGLVSLGVVKDAVERWNDHRAAGQSSAVALDGARPASKLAMISYGDARVQLARAKRAALPWRAVLGGLAAAMLISACVHALSFGGWMLLRASEDANHLRLDCGDAPLCGRLTIDLTTSAPELIGLALNAEGSCIGPLDPTPEPDYQPTCMPQARAAELWQADGECAGTATHRAFSEQLCGLAHGPMRVAKLIRERGGDPIAATRAVASSGAPVLGLARAQPWLTLSACAAKTTDSGYVWMLAREVDFSLLCGPGALAPPVPHVPSSTPPKRMSCRGAALCGVLTISLGAPPRVHGLWPQVGVYGDAVCEQPEDMAWDGLPRAWSWCYPDSHLAAHEFTKHGWCSGVRDAGDYVAQTCSLAHGPLAVAERLQAEGKSIEEIGLGVQQAGYPVYSVDLPSAQGNLALSACAIPPAAPAAPAATDGAEPDASQPEGPSAHTWILAHPDDFFELCGGGGGS